MQRSALSFILLVVFLLFDQVGAASPNLDSDRAWQSILEQAVGPANRFATPEEAVKAIRAHLDKQEVSLREFSRVFPGDPRHYSAVVRLSSVLAAKGRLLKQPGLRTEALTLLSGLEDDAALPLPIKADAGFARVTQAMDEAAGRNDEPTRESLLSVIRSFDVRYPADRRTAGLLTEVATLFDSQPAKKLVLLEEAVGRTTDETLRKRIRDDQKRVARLGNPLDLQLIPWQGGKPVSLSALRGHVVVILFWASWSLPALRELGQLEQTAAELSGQPVDFLTVSLDTDRKALAEACQAANLHWPVHCDGRGWEGELVRSLGINALPTVWILDRKGNLLTLNARGAESVALIREALAKK